MQDPRPVPPGGDLGGERTPDVPRIALGLVMIAGGTLLTLSNIGTTVEIHFFGLWPLIFVVLGVLRLFGRDLVGALTFFFIAGVFILPQVHPDISFRDVIEQWPLFLVAIGVLTVLRSIFPTRPKDHEAGAKRSAGGLAIFRTASERPDDPAYRGEQLTAVVGGYNLNLERCELHPDGAVLDVFAFWGGIEITVPRHWRVDTKVTPFMGGADDKSRPDEVLPGQPGLTIRGVVVMGGIEVRN